MQKAKLDEEAGGGQDRKQFEMGTSSSSRAFEVESWAFVPHQHYSLQLKQRVEESLVGDDKIPATFHEILAFFRVYTSSVEKIQKFGMSVFDLNRFVWNGIFGFVLKSLPLNYVHLFLASYVPHEHMYIPKMAPLWYGHNIVIVLVTVTVFVFASESMLLLLYYAFYGLYQSGPWDRCAEDVFINENARNATVNCLPTQKFRDLIATSLKSQQGAYYFTVTDANKTTALYIPAPMKFYDELHVSMFTHSNVLGSTTEALAAAIVLAVIGLCRRQTYKRTIWKVINYSHWILSLFYLGAMLHIFIYSLETKMTEYFEPRFYTSLMGKTILTVDFDMFADFLGAPPILHFIASKSIHQLQMNPAGGSATLVFSNSINYFMKGVTMYLLKRYCEHEFKIGLSLHMAGLDIFFSLWPLYMSLVPFGTVLTCVFFFLHGLSEFLTFIIAYNISIECIQSAWPKFKWWIILIFTFCYLLLVRFLLSNASFHSRYWFKLILYPFVKGSSALADILIIVCFYPIGRLEDDIIFHTGSPLPKAISIAIRLLPLYLFLKLYITIKAFYDFQVYMNDAVTVKYIHRLFIYLSLSFICGLVYAIIKNLFIVKQNWRAWFRPVPQWGPPDHIQRQLRKQFDSREYIASTASRYLSRYLKSKLSSRMYRLDVCYETDRGRRRSTVVLDSFRYDDEKKKDL